MDMEDVMTRWSKFRVESEVAEEIPETTYEAKVFLDNAWRHLMVQYPKETFAARMILHDLAANV